MDEELCKLKKFIKDLNNALESLFDIENKAEFLKIEKVTSSNIYNKDQYEEILKRLLQNNEISIFVKKMILEFEDGKHI